MACGWSELPRHSSRRSSVERAGRTVDPRRAAGAAAVAAVLEADRVLHRPFRAAHRDVEAGEERIGVVRAELRPVPPLAADSGGAGDHVRDLAGEAGDLERGAVDDLDPLDVARRDAAQLRHDVVRFAGEPLAVDDDVAGGLAEAARIFLLLDGEAGNAVEHVERRLRRELRKVGGHVGARALHRSRCGGVCARSGTASNINETNSER